MAVREVSASAANAAEGSALEAACALVNDLQAELAALATKLDADAGVSDTDYGTVIGNTDTISFRETGEPD